MLYYPLLLGKFCLAWGYYILVLVLSLWLELTTSGNKLFEKALNRISKSENNLELSKSDILDKLTNCIQVPAKHTKSIKNIFIENPSYEGLYSYKTRRVYLNSRIKPDSVQEKLVIAHESMHWAFDNLDDAYDLAEALYVILKTEDKLTWLFCHSHGVQQAALQKSLKGKTLSTLEEEYWCDFIAMALYTYRLRAI